MSRQSLVRLIHDAHVTILDLPKEDLRCAKSKISATFDIWTDRCTRGYLGLAGHYYDKNGRLKAPLLVIKYLGKSQGGYDANSIIAQISTSMHDLLGGSWQGKLYCFVTDEASNVTRASQSLANDCDGESRRCVQHAIQLFIKHLCATQHRVATAMSSCNFISKLSKVSQNLSVCIGRIATGTPTR